MLSIRPVRRASAILTFTLLLGCMLLLVLALFDPFAARASDNMSGLTAGSLKDFQPVAPPGPGVTDAPPQKTKTARPKAENPGVPNRTGGPDEYGYVFSDDRDPGGPPPVTDGNWHPGVNRVADDAWMPIRSSNSDPLDDGVITTTLPFSFTLYGVNYGTLHIATNGNVHFGLPNDYWPGASGDCLPSESEFVPKAMLAPLFQDLIVPDDSQPGGVYTDIVGTAPNRDYIVEWRSVTDYTNPDAFATFSLVLSEGGDITFRYRSLPDLQIDGSDAVIGIQNETGTIGLDYSCFEQAIIPSRAIRFRLQPSVILSPLNAERGGSPGSTLVYTETLYNQTGITNSFTIAPSGNVWTTTVEPLNTGELGTGASIPITVNVEIPPDATIGESDVVTVTASSDLPNPGDFVAESMLTSSVSSFGVDFSPGEEIGAGDYGSTVTYTLSIYNRTGQDNSFIFHVSDNAWPTTVSPAQTGLLAPDDAQQITVTVNVPIDTVLGDSDIATLTADGQEPTPGFFFGITRITTYAGVWARKSLLPTPRSRGAAVSFPANGRIYALGGEYNNGDTHMPVLEYDPIVGRWTPRADLPVGVSNVGAAVIGDAIYIPGGYSSSSGHAQSVLQIYYPFQNRVEVVATDPLPVPRIGSGVAALDGRLYIIGGSDDTLVPTNTVYEYDPSRPAGSRWNMKSPMPTPRIYLGVASLDERIYAAGGIDSSLNDLDTVETYDPATDSWSELAPMSVSRGGLALVGVNSAEAGCGGSLYALGGGWRDYTNTAERYNPTEDTWSPVSPLLLARRSLAAAYSTSTYSLVAFGGWLGSYDGTTEAIGCGGGLTLPTPTPTPIVTATPVPTACALTFTDVPEGSAFYPFIGCLACRGIISGYGDGTFRPNTDVTRGQLSKIVANAGGLDGTPSVQTYEDVPADSTFYVWIERLTAVGAIGGYPCGSLPGEPCAAPDNRPYFRPGANATRGQISKIVSTAAGFDGTPLQQTYEDVLSSSTFYLWIERLASRDIMGGYPCGTRSEEPCVAPGNRPYFRPNANATRGQMAKIVSGTFFPGCQTPVR